MVLNTAIPIIPDVVAISTRRFESGVKQVEIGTVEHGSTFHDESRAQQQDEHQVIGADSHTEDRSNTDDDDDGREDGSSSSSMAMVLFSGRSRMPSSSACISHFHLIIH